MSGFSLCSDKGNLAGRETVEALAEMKTLSLNSPRGRERGSLPPSTLSAYQFDEASSLILRSEMRGTDS